MCIQSVVKECQIKNNTFSIELKLVLLTIVFELNSVQKWASTHTVRLPVISMSEIINVCAVVSLAQSLGVVKVHTTGNLSEELIFSGK